MNILDWCIIGGESGNNLWDYRQRKMELSLAAVFLVIKTQENNLACFVKQLDTY